MALWSFDDRFRPIWDNFFFFYAFGHLLLSSVFGCGSLFDGIDEDLTDFLVVYFALFPVLVSEFLLWSFVFKGRISRHDGEVSGVLFQHLVEKPSLFFWPLATCYLCFVNDFVFFGWEMVSWEFQVVYQLEESLGSGELWVLFGLVWGLALGGRNEVAIEFELMVLLELLGVFF
jgi:hypothetical protein